MPELRWILLVAGLLLIGGLYAWGVRSRRRSAPPPPERMTARVEPPRPVVRTAPAEPRVEPRRVEPRIETAAVEPEPEPGGEHDSLDDTDRLPVLEIEADFETDSAAEADAEALPEAEPEPLESPPAPRAATRREPRLAAAAEAPEARPAPAAPGAPERPRKPAAQKIVVVRVVAAPPGNFAGATLVQALRAEHLEFGRYDIFHRLEATGRPVFSVASLREPGTFDLATVNDLEFRGIALFCVLPGPWPGLRSFDAMIAAARALASRLDGVLQDEKGAALSVQRIGRLREEVVEFEHSQPRSAG